MTKVADLFEDPFLNQKLNPIFLETLKGYWATLQNAQVSDEEKIQIREALYNLVRFAFQHLFQPLYLKYVPKVKGRIFLLSAVHSDGIGDYIATLKCAQLLKEFYPEIDVHVAYTHKQKLPALDSTFPLIKRENIHAFLETTDSLSNVLGNVLEGKKEFSFTQELEKLFREKESILGEYETLKASHPKAGLAIKELADELDRPIKQIQYFMQKKVEADHLYEMMKHSQALIHIALAINTFDNPDFARNSLYFAESGNFQGIANYLQRNWFSMGLDAFEEGIFLKKQNETTQWMYVKLSKFLWKVEQPSSDQIADYLKQYNLLVGYLPNVAEMRYIFIEMMCHRYIQDDRHIDIILPYQENEEFQKFNTEWMTSFGISKVIVVEFNRTVNERVFAEIELPVEKHLRLINVLPVPSSDFIKLINLGGDIVGCTGDGSLSDCIIADKIPFYEVRHHKIQILAVFRHLARVLALPDVIDYFEQLELFSAWPAVSFIEKFEAILSGDAFKSQWKMLIEFIRRYYCFEDSFLAHISRHLFSHLAWEIREKEEMLIQSYFEGAISAEEAYDTLEKMLKNRTNI